MNDSNAATPPRAQGESSLRVWFYVIGFLGLAIAIASIADMFSPRPYDGIIPMPYSRKGIDVRATMPGGPAEKARIPAGDCVLGIGNRLDHDFGADACGIAHGDCDQRTVGHTGTFR